VTEVTKNFANGAIETIEQVASNPHEFQVMVGKAQMSQDRVVEVTAELFDYLLNGQKAPFIMYGNPGVRVYKVGTRDEIERREDMTLDQIAQLRAKDMETEKNG
jgi:hypothetical protein